MSAGVFPQAFIDLMTQAKYFLVKYAKKKIRLDEIELSDDPTCSRLSTGASCKS